MAAAFRTRRTCGQNRQRSRRVYWHVCLIVAALVVYASVPAPRSQATDFACRAGEVDCLINAINMANANGQANIITLKAGT